VAFWRKFGMLWGSLGGAFATAAPATDVRPPIPPRSMQIQINTDNHISGRDELAEQVRAVIADTLERFRDQVTRVEAHLSDENSHKSNGPDKRCVLEARLEGRPPVAVTHQAEIMMQAVNGAAEKLKTSLTSTLGRLHDR
jgi:ribosome-associated translation inhibitor RaiA